MVHEPKYPIRKKEDCRMIQPLKIEPNYHPNDIIKICVGTKAQENFLLSMAMGEPKAPCYTPPINTDMFECDWSCVLCKNVIITGKLPREMMNHFFDLLLVCGAWSICGVDDDGELHLQNADIFRSKGFELRGN